jgi:hypothetical protein
MRKALKFRYAMPKNLDMSDLLFQHWKVRVTDLCDDLGSLTKTAEHLHNEMLDEMSKRGRDEILALEDTFLSLEEAIRDLGNACLCLENSEEAFDSAKNNLAVALEEALEEGGTVDQRLGLSEEEPDSIEEIDCADLPVLANSPCKYGCCPEPRPGEEVLPTVLVEDEL